MATKWYPWLFDRAADELPSKLHSTSIQHHSPPLLPPLAFRQHRLWELLCNQRPVKGGAAPDVIWPKKNPEAPVPLTGAVAVLMDQAKDDGHLRSSTASPELPSQTKAGTGSAYRVEGRSNKTDRLLSITPIPLKFSQIPKSTSTSTTNSPKASRETSPSRPSVRASAASSRASKDKSNSSASAAAPSIPSVPSAAALQRALSSANAPQLLPTVLIDPSIRAPQPQKPDPRKGDSLAGWPASPARLKSPPPTTSAPRQLRKTDPLGPTPNIVLRLPSPSSLSSFPEIHGGEIPNSNEEDSSSLANMRTPLRGIGGSVSTLETVQEGSLPPTPSTALADRKFLGKRPGEERPEKTGEMFPENMPARSMSMVESGSESGGARSDDKARGKSISATIASKLSNVANAKAYGGLGVRAKAPGEALTQNMTVETETVSSIPQVAVGGGAGERGGLGRGDTIGSLRLKPSTETIRPRKDRKKSVRKATSVHTGNASSKADIFEAKVASAVDEANSSDSEETFVYESNPPEVPIRPVRHHSRTPSATSIQSAKAQRGGVAMIQTNLDGHHSVGGKRSMKFAHNPYHNSSNQSESTDAGGAGRGSTLNGGRGAAHHVLHHQHIGQRGRGGRESHGSLFDTNSPFPNVTKQPRANNSPRNASLLSSPRNLHQLRLGGNGKKAGPPSYDIDVEGADDEATPLLTSGTMRSNRSNRRRPGSASLRQLEYNQQRRQGWVTRTLACILISITIFLVLFSGALWLFATANPLAEVEVQRIQNVLASEQELMLDLVVMAINPNILSVAVSDLDINVFAKSKYVPKIKLSQASDPFSRMDWEKRRKSKFLPSQQDSDYNIQDDPPGDLIPDPKHDPQTMLLGRILEFDSALSFQGSPFRHSSDFSIGEVRLAKPGNKTEDGGSKRWEQIVRHPFELIIRGVLKYQLPLSTRVRTAPIGARVSVHPESGVDDKGRMWVEPIHFEHPGSNMDAEPIDGDRARIN
ncbi:MAG: hypothetical protein M1829_004945 [Trizodia sp. TS-e1964]|nr:MAG: hypothetical protein M1829_004945 [Trizodia sp. TS-e1964]